MIQRRLPLLARTTLLALALTAACGESKSPSTAAGADVSATADASAGLAADAETGDAATGAEKPLFVTNPERTPLGVHATWQRDPATSLTLTWTTQAKDMTAYQPRVWFAPVSAAGADGANLPFDAANFAAGSGMQYDTLIADAAGSTIAVTWNVELTGLQPDTEYVYRVGTYEAVDLATKSFTAPDWSPAYTMRTAPQKGSRKPYTFVMAGDSRGGSDKMRANMKRAAPLVGYEDINALAWFFNGDFTPFGHQFEWNDWFDAMQPVLTKRVLMPVQGNHEVIADVYYGQFELPRIAALPEELKEHVWSLDIGNVHFVGLDSNTTDNVSHPDVLAWLKADLEAADKDPDIDWTIVMMHHAPYSASKHGSTKRLQEHWVPLFEAHGVDLVFSGHDHNYERTKPIRGNQVADDATAPVYVVAGAFYAPAYSNGQEWWTATSTHGSKANYVVMDVDGKTMRLKALSGDGAEVLDETTFTR